MAQITTPSGAVIEDTTGALITPPPTAAPTPPPAPQPAPMPTPTPTPAPLPTPAPAPVVQPVLPAPIPAPAAKMYNVQAGDTLSAIAAKFGVPISDISGYRSGDPNRIFPGESLTIGKTVPTPTPTPVESTVMEDTGFDPSQEIRQYFQSVFGQNSDALQYGFNTNPAKTVKDLVQEVMLATGLPDASAQLNQISKEIEELQNEQADKVADINDNPFLSAGTKRARIEQLDEKYSQRIDSRTNRLKLIQGAYDDARQQAQFAATTAISLFDKNQNFEQNKLEFAISEAEKFLTAQNKSNEIDTQVVEVGNRKVLIDSETGATIKDLGPASTGSGGGTPTRSGNLVYTNNDYSSDSSKLEASRGDDGWVDPAIYQRLYRAWLDEGGTSKDFIAKFPPKLFVNPANNTLPPILRNTTGSGLDADIDALFNSSVS